MATNCKMFNIVPGFVSVFMLLLITNFLLVCFTSLFLHDLYEIVCISVYQSLIMASCTVSTPYLYNVI